jgi:D-sedoheptulose 7-phosphate isomerase
MEQHIDNPYIEELIRQLNLTEIRKGDREPCPSYNEGIRLLVDTFTSHKQDMTQVFFLGNGGSAAIAGHMTADFMKNGGMKTYSLYDTSVTTCMGNDYGYEHIFSRPLEFLGNPGDLLVAISSSGNSQNIVNAIQAAEDKEMQVITFSGFQRDNRISSMGTYNIYVPSNQYGIVESIHNLMLQQIVDTIMGGDGECL